MNLPAFFRLTSDEMLAYLQARGQSVPAQAPAGMCSNNARLSTI